MGKSWRRVGETEEMEGVEETLRRQKVATQPPVAFGLNLDLASFGQGLLWKWPGRHRGRTAVS